MTRSAYLPGSLFFHQVPLAEGRMGSAECGKQPSGPARWEWDPRVLSGLGPCPYCPPPPATKESPVKHQKIHVDFRLDVVTEAQTALHEALTQIGRVRLVSAPGQSQECGQDCCLRQVEVEDLEADLDDAVRRLRGVLRLLGVQQGRLEALAEEEQ